MSTSTCLPRLNECRLLPATGSGPDRCSLSGPLSVSPAHLVWLALHEKYAGVQNLTRSHHLPASALVGPSTTSHRILAGASQVLPSFCRDPHSLVTAQQPEGSGRNAVRHRLFYVQTLHRLPLACSVEATVLLKTHGPHTSVLCTPPWPGCLSPPHHPPLGSLTLALLAVHWLSFFA